MSNLDNSRISALRLRSVKKTDRDQLTRLYKVLDTCNGTTSKVKDVIERSIKGLGGDFKNATYIVENVEFDRTSGAEKVRAVGTGSLIKIDHSEESAIEMYEDDGNDLKRVKREGAALEFAAIVVDPEVQNSDIGKTISLVRALIARKYAGLFGVERMITEFLPQYDDEDSKSNAFWRDLIHAHLSSKGLLEEIKKESGEFLGKAVETDQDLLFAFVRDLDSRQRNLLIQKYFPEKISAEKITPAARLVMKDVGKRTKGAQINLDRLYAGEFQKIGYFAVDGGLNYSAPVDHGALGERTVKLAYLTPDTPINLEKAVVFEPLRDTAQDLRRLTAFTVEGIFGPRSASIPAEVGEMLNIAEGGEVTYRKLPLSSAKGLR